MYWDFELLLTILAFMVSAVSCVFGVLSFANTARIHKQQESNAQNEFLMSHVVETYNYLETDIMLLAQGTYDSTFEKDKLDHDALLSISISKSYALVINNQNLFDYVDSLLTEKCSEDMGALIEDYFKDRKVAISESIVNGKIDSALLKEKGNKLRQKYLERTRDLRNATIKRIKKIIKK